MPIFLRRLAILLVAVPILPLTLAAQTGAGIGLNLAHSAVVRTNPGIRVPGIRIVGRPDGFDTNTSSASTFAVQVTPDGGDSLRVSIDAYATAAFTVTNTGTSPARFAVTAACNAVADTCTATRDTIDLAPGESQQAGVLFRAKTTAGLAGSVSLTARMVGNAAVTDAGWQGVRLVAQASLNAAGQQRAVLDRGECVTVSLGGGAASECGDLRLAHALPATRTLNRGRAPVLLYSSQHAYPYTLLNVNVANPSGAAWDSVSAVVRRGGVVMASGRWPGWSDAASRQLALGFAETGLSATAPSAAVFTDTFVVSVRTGGAWVQHSATALQHVVVDRRGSPFGSGWWLAGLERIEFIAAGFLWTGGDGSARLYQNVAPSRWASAEPEGPDTIAPEYISRIDGTTEIGYVRRLPGGGRVAFRNNGQHVYTRNRLGQTTWFEYDAQGRLSRIIVPTAVTGDTSLSYRFTYNSAAGTLGEVAAPYILTPGDRRTVLSASGTAGAVRVTQITDFPDGNVVEVSTTQYDYDPQGRATQVRAPGTLTPTELVYSGGSRLKLARTIGTSNGRTDTLAVAVTPVETRSLPNAAGTLAPTGAGSFTAVDGPLPGGDDYVRYYLDAAGRVSKVTTPLGSTRLYRQDARYPALVTFSVAPNGHTVTASYDGRGRLSSQTDWNPLGDGRNATTLYTWSDAWDEVTSVTSPTGITTTFGYDDRGLREWQQVGPDTARRVRYAFNAQGQVTSVRSVSAALRGEQAEAIGYHASTGNLTSITSPLGIQTTTLADRIGRDTLVVAPADTQRTSTGNGGLLYSYAKTHYDLASRVFETATWGWEAQGYESKMDGMWRQTRFFAERTRNNWDAAGRLWKVERWSEPDSAGIGIMITRYEFDGFNRTTAEIAPDGQRDSYYFDPAGRDTLTINRRGEPIRMRYDALGHLLTRAMAGDSSTFTYDPVTGAMTGADNASARIRRSYYPGGALRGDTMHVAFGDGSFVPGRHLYGIRYDYDLEGRRTALTLPDSVRPSASQAQIRYGYDPVTGDLAQITDPLGFAHTFRYRTDGALDTLRAPGGVVQTHTYDADGRLTLRVRGSADGELYRDSARYDLRGKTIRTRTLTGTTQLAYDGLGHLVHSFSNEWTGAKVPESEEEYVYDGLGNKLWHRRTNYSMQVVNTAPVYPTVEYYAAGTARDTGTVAAPGIYIAETAPPRQTVMRHFDAAGNLFRSDEVNPVKLLYGAAEVSGRTQPQTAYAEPDGTSGASGTSADGQQQVITSYTYRPDGKLTLVERGSTCIYTTTTVNQCTSQVPGYNEQTRTEAFRYDALGRRVRVQTSTLIDTSEPRGGCVFRCDNTTRRTVWDGDQVLAEIRYPTAQGEQDTGLDSANVAEQAYRDARGTTAAGHPYGGRNTSDWAQSGRVLYVHGGGIDQPLGLIRMDYSYDFPGPIGIVPHASWRGTYETATFVGPNCVQVYIPYSEVVYQDSSGRKTSPASVTDENGIERDTTQQRCVEVDFPGKYQGMTRLLRRQTASGPISWMGSLVQDAQDASGLMFRRNRYYDPASGRFTQEDPIGLAGGVNAYGFAGGDPVNYSDPYGLNGKDQRTGREVPCLNPRSQSHESSPEQDGPREQFNVLKFAVGATNTVRGMASINLAVDELAIASAGGPFAPVVAVPGTWHAVTGAGNLTRGARQMGESLHDRSGPSVKNLLGLAPFGQKYDDPVEPGPVGWVRSIYRRAVADPVSAAKQAVRDFFAIGN